ncbi:MAG: hypothetical protein IAE63_06820 [Alphaproteobacteria bacterium]|nr:hypothetical protein [Alphaproteobacteria bacterium]
MGGIGSMITGSGQKKAQRQAEQAAKAAELRAEEARKSQEAVVARQTISEQKRAEDLSGRQASLVRAAAARRSGRNALSYVTNGLKKTLGA